MKAPQHLNALRAFEAAARHLSFVAAADELNVTPAAVGQLVRGLEEVLGVELFHRSRSGPARLVLTDIARNALPELEAGFCQLASAMELLRAGRPTVIALTVPPAFADKWLLGRVDRFQALHPEFDLRIDTNGRVIDLAAEGIDVGIRYGAGRWPGVQATFLLSDDFFPVCSPILLSGRYPLRSPEDLAYHALIHDRSMAFEKSFPTWGAWLEKAGVPEISADKGLQINDSAAVIQAAIAGNGVALGRSSLVARDLAEGRLVRPFGDSLPYEFAYYIVRKPGPANEGVRAFEKWLLSEARAFDPQMQS
ncbi:MULTISPECIES: transcriptional regulator GcvA [unclassified Sinorhizobium]|uniref:transcriptional regulator GcvA n=1 Tax=unclassified Sinorhizobium TaxID=2613772 RepID=UPI0035247F42